MTTHPDLGPAASHMAALVEGVTDGDMARRTPCPRYTVGDLLDHIGGLALAFTAAAAKQPLDSAASGDAAELGADWRTRIPTDLRTLAEAWRDPEAWTGMTAAGGVDLPGEVAGVVALDELVVHGWDLARATGQPVGYDEPELEAVHTLVQQFDAGGTDGVFGPAVDVAEDAPLLDRIVGRAGRDPAWEPVA